ncbi:MAG TPA: AraC family transcriptional regulator [Acidobacteriota bacterium]|nr:AraC family transcriptional regulator [Acidobacteriota bacterium]
MATDVLSNVLRTVRLTGAVFYYVEASPPWSAVTSYKRPEIPQIMPDAGHLISFHVVTHGDCYGTVKGLAPVHLEAGDLIVFPHGDPHVMASDPAIEAVDDLTPRSLGTQRPFILKEGPAHQNPKTTIVCGFLGCDARPFNPLINTLPRVMHLKASTTPKAVWLNNFIHYAAMESKEKRAGGEAVLAQLSELLFVEAVRIYLDSLPSEQTGWLSGLRDPYIGLALSLMHERPAHSWGLEELAHQVALSRSVLAERFTHLVGQPPMQYLTQWRMQIASGLLSRGSAKIAQVAAEAGYDSEAAFSRAFKKFVGISPAEWRKRKSSAPSDGV